MRYLLLIWFTAISSVHVFSQEHTQSKTELQSDYQKYTYAYVSIEGKIFSKKLKVDVDLGDKPEQIEEGKVYSNQLTNKKSYAAILNHMVKNGFELVETLERTDTYSGTGGTSGIVFIMKKKMVNDNGGEISHNGNKQ